MTLQELQNLNPVELEFISTQIYKLIKDKVTDQTSNYDNFKNRIKCCPHRGSIHFIKYGFNKKHRQKFYCKDCKTFLALLQIRFILIPYQIIIYGRILSLAK